MLCTIDYWFVFVIFQQTRLLNIGILDPLNGNVLKPEELYDVRIDNVDHA